jgi:F0F1-type ATP synthase membrane subunit c/vacuolar-type H+-ATPase subunit K
VNLAARVLAYTLTLVIPIAGIGAAFLVSWCISRVVLSVTRNDGAAYLSFFVGMVVTGAAFIYWVWVPLRPMVKRLSGKRG